jgi:hypothetical protein
LLWLTAIPFFVFAVLLLAFPVGDWITDGAWPAGVRGAEAAAGAVLLTAAALLVAAGYLAARIVEVVLLVPNGGRFQKLLQSIVGARRFWFIPGALAIAGIVAGIAGLSEGGGRGLFSMVVLGAAAVLAGVTRLLDRFINVVAERLRYERNVAARQSALG